jgi:hypothetical protein
MVFIPFTQVGELTSLLTILTKNKHSHACSYSTSLYVHVFARPEPEFLVAAPAQQLLQLTFS